jgi:GMP synthase (glutamine-hydrolysing)
MNPLLCIRHERSDTLGVARGAFEEEGLPILVVDAWADGRWPEPDEVSGLLAMGGAMNVDELDRHPYLARERALLGRVMEAGIPVMGVCLGAQLMARALGQPVFRAPRRRCGFIPIYPTEEGQCDPVAGGFSSGDLEFHWNEDTFELPPGATLLASGPGDSVEAYRVGGRAWGIAFHPEVDGPELDGWIEQAGPAIEHVWGRSADDLKGEAERRLPAHQERGGELFRRFARFALEAARQ